MVAENDTELQRISDGNDQSSPSLRADQLLSDFPKNDLTNRNNLNVDNLLQNNFRIVDGSKAQQPEVGPMPQRDNEPEVGPIPKRDNEPEVGPMPKRDPDASDPSPLPSPRQELDDKHPGALPPIRDEESLPKRDDSAARPDQIDNKPTPEDQVAKFGIENAIQRTLDKKNMMNDGDTRKEILTDLKNTLSAVSPEQAKTAIEELNQKLKDAGSKTNFELRTDTDGKRTINMRSEGERGPGSSISLPSEKPSDAQPKPSDAQSKPNETNENNTPKKETVDNQGNVPSIDKSIQSVLDKKDSLNDDDVRKDLLKDLTGDLAKLPSDKARSAVEQLNSKLKDAGAKTEFKIFTAANGERTLNMRSEGERGPGTSRKIDVRESQTAGERDTGRDSKVDSTTKPGGKVEQLPPPRTETSDNAKPEGKPGEAKPEATKPGEVKPEGKPGETKSEAKEEPLTRESANKAFKDAGQAFVNASDADRRQAFKNLAKSFGNLLARESGDGVQTAVTNLNRQLEDKGIRVTYHPDKHGPDMGELNLRSSADRDKVFDTQIFNVPPPEKGKADARGEGKPGSSTPAEVRTEGKPGDNGKPEQLPPPRTESSDNAKPEATKPGDANNQKAPEAVQRELTSIADSMKNGILESSREQAIANQLTKALAKLSPAEAQTAVDGLNKQLNDNGSKYSFRLSNQNGSQMLTMNAKGLRGISALRTIKR